MSCRVSAVIVLSCRQTSRNHADHKKVRRVSFSMAHKTFSWTQNPKLYIFMWRRGLNTWTNNVMITLQKPEARNQKHVYVNYQCRKNENSARRDTIRTKPMPLLSRAMAPESSSTRAEDCHTASNPEEKSTNAERIKRALSLHPHCQELCLQALEISQSNVSCA